MKLKNTLIIGLATLTLISCNDFLDVDSPSSYNEDFVFSQETEISRALNGVYASILVGDLYGSAYQKTFNLNSDVDMQMYTGNVATHNSYARFDCDDQGGEIDKYWRASYKAIEDANRFIRGVETGPLYNEENTAVMQMLGEAKCLRAMVYHDLVVMFGDVPFFRFLFFTFPYFPAILTDGHNLILSLLCSKFKRNVFTFHRPVPNDFHFCGQRFFAGFCRQVFLYWRQNLFHAAREIPL
jgi:hypothetical protein